MFESRINKIFLFLIYISVFINSYIFTKEPAEIYVGYLVYMILLPVFFSRHHIPGYFLIIFGILLVNGLINSYLGYDTYPNFFKIFLGVFFSYLFYYYVVVQFEYNVEKLFQFYLTGCYIVSIIGIIQFISFQINFVPGYDYRWVFNKWGVTEGGNFGIRLNSVFAEPSYHAACISAGAFVSMYNLMVKKPYFLSKQKSLVILITYLLTFSGMAFIAVFIIVIVLLINFGFVRYVLFFTPIVIGSFIYLYNNVNDFRERFESTSQIFLTGEFEVGISHGSSIILYNNYTVAIKNFSNNFVFGAGLGSHEIAFNQYSLTKDIKIEGINQNAKDANSMLLRLLSETGLFGVLLILGLTIKFFIRRRIEDYIPESYWLISGGIFTMIIVNLFRQGHYFLHGFPFFIWLYYFNYINYKEFLSETIVTKSSPQNSEPVLSN